MKPKEPLPTTEQSAVVYSITRLNCNTGYVGETGKRLGTRLHEHQLAINRKDKTTLVYGHIRELNHDFGFEKARVIGRANEKMARLVLESWSSAGTLNRAIDLHPAYEALRTRLGSVRTGPVMQASTRDRESTLTEKRGVGDQRSCDQSRTLSHRCFRKAECCSHEQQRPISPPADVGEANRKNSKASLLDVNVTTEIKGWMQIGILAYHYTDAYFILPIFIVIRLFVSMYVVLSAYGHFCYYWRKNYLQEEEMLKLPVCRRVCICLKRLLYRYIQVLFRMNFLVILLCPIFQQPYMKYYFVTLITTAYTLSAATMTAWMFLLFLVELTCCHRPKGVSIPASELPVMGWLKAALEFVEKHRKDICFLLVLSLAGLYSHLLHTSTALFSYTFFRRPLIYLFGPENGQWRYRWSIDSYSTVLGLALGYAVSKLKELRQRKEGDAIPPETGVGTSARQFRIPGFILSCLITAGSGVILLTYIVLGIRSAGSHKQYTNLHPYTMSVGLRGTQEVLQQILPVGWSICPRTLCAPVPHVDHSSRR
nr:unnamed protein product [Spirometra erinaceieuropaei]